MSVSGTFGPGERGRRSRAWLLVLLGACHLLAVPCAMALANQPVCGHCEGGTDVQPCLSDGGGMSLAQPGPAMDGPGLPPRTSVPALVVPVPAPAGLALVPGRLPAAHTGRHTGDPPCRLRFGNLRI